MALAAAICAPVTGAMSQSAGMGFVGTATTVHGIANVSTNNDVVTVGNSDSTGAITAVINWSTDNSQGHFLPSGNSVIFEGGSNNISAYTVLNRISPTDTASPVVLNGAIQSYLDSAHTTTGGSIWFYSPSGILVGSNAVFNIGSLLLTANDPVIDTQGNFLDSNGHFSLQTAVAGTQVSVDPGAQINALSPGSYVALVAPRVVQNGTVTVNGSAAYVAAGAVDMTINQGLFDITVTEGTDQTNPINHGGTTTGPASGEASGDPNPHRIYLVAVPKNDVITQLYIGSGSLGFDVAGAADVQGNAIVLSAGRNISGGAIDFSTPAPINNADITVQGGTFTSAVFGGASRNISVFDYYGPSNPNGASTPVNMFASDLNLRADSVVNLGATRSTDTLGIGGSVTLSASKDATVAGEDVQAGFVGVYGQYGGTLKIAGDLSMYAEATGNGSSVNSGVPVSAHGGQTEIVTPGGTVDVIGNT
jgi:filamentous hemagglutinin family protein